MKLAIFGANGNIGQRLVREALSRGHEVTALVRDTRKAQLPAGVRVEQANALDTASVAGATAGYDAVISAIGPTQGAPDEIFSEAARTLSEGVKQSGAGRLLVVGGAGSLEVAPGVQLVDTPEFPALYKSNALAQREALAVYREQDVDWTYVSPSALIEPGERTGTYRIGSDQLLQASDGSSRITIEDFAAGILDELEQPQFIRRRLTIGY